MGDLFLTLDVGSTLGRFTGDRVEERLAELAQKHHPKSSPRPGENPWRAMASEISRWFLHIAPKLTDDLIEEVCEYLMVPRKAWPATWSSGFEPYEYTKDTLERMSRFGGMATLSNISIVTGPQKMLDLGRTLGDYLEGVHTSYQLETRKPHHLAWRIVAARHSVQVADIVHIGDRVVEDVYGALNAGCRGAILVNTRGALVPKDLHDHPRVRVLDDLRGVPFALREAFRETA